jgi:hypothetical protein
VEYFRYAIDDTSTQASWFETDDFEITLFFTAPDSSRIDSIYIGAATVPLERYVFNGAHTFFVVAVDDDGAQSPPAFKSFTAESVAPETEILTPTPDSEVILGPDLRVTWTGHDPDDFADPTGYSWRLIRAQNIIALSDEEIEALLLDPAAPGTPWSPFEAIQSVQTRFDSVGAQYLFGVRAMDQAGVVEPRLRSYRSPAPPNVLRIATRPNAGQPRLRVSTAGKSTRYPVSDPRDKVFYIAANTEVLVTWEAEVDHYGGEVAGFAYGIDLEYLGPDNPRWSEESPDLDRVQVRFDIPAGGDTETHDLFIRVRDTFGGELIAELDLMVLPFRPARDVLYVDDWGMDLNGLAYPDAGPFCRAVSEGGTIPDERIQPSASVPQDGCHDALIMMALDDALAATGRADWIVDRYEPLDPLTGEALTEDFAIDSLSADHWVLTGPIDLEQLSRYKLIVWNTRSSSANALTRLNAAFERHDLAVFLSSGGHVWLTGTGVFARSLDGGIAPGLDIFGYHPEDFTYRMLRVESVFDGADCQEGCFRQSGSDARRQRDHGFEGAVASPMAAAEGFPDLRVGRAPFADNPARGVPDCDAMVVPYGLDMNPRLELVGGQLDTLYLYQSNLRLEVTPPGTSYMDDGATALRFRGPGQGNLMMFGFPLVYLPADQLEPMLTASLTWLLED